MIYGLFFTSVSMAAEPLQFTTNVHTHYLAGEPIILTITATNAGSTAITIPDLSMQPWRASFQFIDKKGQKRKHSNQKNNSTKQWTLAPRNTRSVQLTVPSGAGFTAGNYQFELNINLDDQQYTEKKDIVIQTPQSNVVDTFRQHEQRTSALWYQPTAQGFDLYFHNGQWNEYVLTHQQKMPVSLLRCLRCQGNFIWQQKRTIHVGKKHKISLPWQQSERLGRGVLDGKGNTHIPMWVPQPKGTKGSLYVLTVNRRGQPTYRKMRGNISQPQDLQVSLNNVGIAMVLLSTSSTLEMFHIKETKEPIPVHVQQLYKATQQQTIRDARFGIHPQNGLSILISFQQSPTPYSQWHTLSGRPIGSGFIFPVQANETILDVSTAPNLINWLVRSSSGAILVRREKNQQKHTKAMLLRQNTPIYFNQRGRWTTAKDSAKK